MSERTMVIPAPVALPGQAVEAHNYRIKNKFVFESGKCVRAEYTLYESKDCIFDGKWQYTVILNRRNPRGNCLRLYVGDASIRPWSGTVSEVEA